MSPETRGPWTAQQSVEFLQSARIPVRLAFLTAQGSPFVASHWYVWREDALWCATQRDSFVAQCLAADERSSFEVAGDHPPYREVRGRARATLHAAQGVAILELLIDRYLDDGGGELAQWLRGRADREVAIRLEPEQLVSWDYSARMG